MSAQASDSLDQLRSDIARLEGQQAEEGRILKDQLRGVYDSITPANLLKGALDAVSESKPNLLATAVGLSLGVLSKALFEVGTAGPVRKVIGTLLLVGITKAANPSNIQSIGKMLSRFIGGPSEDMEKDSTPQKALAQISEVSA